MICGDCGAKLATNHELVTVPHGTRIAFDQTRTRVWQVCDKCTHWNLLGTEASARALPELQMRFRAGAVREHAHFATSLIAPELELTRLSVLPDQSESGEFFESAEPRDDIATAQRRDELLKSGRKKIAFNGLVFLAFLPGSIERVGRLLDRRTTGSWIELAVLLAFWYLGLYFLHPDTATKSLVPPGPLRPPKGSRTIDRIGYWLGAAYGLEVVLMWIGLRETISANGWFGPLIAVEMMIALSGLFVLLRRIGLSLRRSATSWLIAIALIVVPTIHLYVLAVERNFALSYFIMAATLFGSFAILGIWMRWSRRRLTGKGEYSISYTDDLGARTTTQLLNVTDFRVSWEASARSVAVRGLPGAKLVGGEDAKAAVRTFLFVLHNGRPPKPRETREAFEFVRAVGGPRGVFESLAGIADSETGEVPFHQLPAVYLAAVDIALAPSDAYSDLPQNGPR